jgi:hypothetical protein
VSVNGQAIVSIFVSKPTDFDALGGLALAVQVMSSLEPDAPAAVPAPAALAAPQPSAAAGKLVVGPPSRALTLADLAGDWAQDNSIVSSYASTSTGNDAGYSAISTSQKWRIDPKGTVYTKLTATSSSTQSGTYQVNEKSSATITVAPDGTLTIADPRQPRRRAGIGRHRDRRDDVVAVAEPADRLRRQRPQRARPLVEQHAGRHQAQRGDAEPRDRRDRDQRLAGLGRQRHDATRAGGEPAGQRRLLVPAQGRQRPRHRRVPAAQLVGERHAGCGQLAGQRRVALRRQPPRVQLVVPDRARDHLGRLALALGLEHQRSTIEPDPHASAAQQLACPSPAARDRPRRAARRTGVRRRGPCAAQLGIATATRCAGAWPAVSFVHFLVMHPEFLCSAR